MNRNCIKGPDNPHAAVDFHLREAACSKLAAFYDAKTAAEGDEELDLEGHRYVPLGFGEPDADGIHRWAVFDNRLDRYLEDAEVLEISNERLMNERLHQ